MDDITFYCEIQNKFPELYRNSQNFIVDKTLYLYMSIRRQM